MITFLPWYYLDWSQIIFCIDVPENNYTWLTPVKYLQFFLNKILYKTDERERLINFVKIFGTYAFKPVLAIQI